MRRAASEERERREKEMSRKREIPKFYSTFPPRPHLLPAAARLFAYESVRFHSSWPSQRRGKSKYTRFDALSPPLTLLLACRDQVWCWYCDRTFEDLKVLIQHQKAKHFRSVHENSGLSWGERDYELTPTFSSNRCPHCPRRLNTAGGLAVHIDQVHKLGTDKYVEWWWYECECECECGLGWRGEVNCGWDERMEVSGVDTRGRWTGQQAWYVGFGWRKKGLEEARELTSNGRGGTRSWQYRGFVRRPGEHRRKLAVSRQ